MKTLGKVDRSTPWEISESEAVKGVFSVKRIAADGRRISVYDNWMMMTEAQAKAVCYALNLVLEGEKQQ
jgi:hypothetical protein